MFITKEDFEQQIKANNLDSILELDATILTDAALTAVAKVKNYLFSGYDIATIFAATGTDRDADLVNHCVNIAMYILYKRVPTGRIPDHVKDDYRDTIILLEKVAEGEIALNLGLKQDEDGEDIVQGFSHSASLKRGQ